MKKIYVQPATELVEVKIQSLMVFGSQQGDGILGGGGNMGDLGNSDVILSRRNNSSIWDDEE